MFILKKKKKKSHLLVKSGVAVVCGIQMCGDPGISVFPDADNIMVWKGMIAGSKDTTYEGIISLLVANAGDCRAVLSRIGVAVEMSKDHRPECTKERICVKSLGEYIYDGYLNEQLGVTRALGDWHLEGMKEMGHHLSGPLSGEPDLKMITLTKEDKFLIIGSDGMWDVFLNQNAVGFTRRWLQEHNDVKLCRKELVEEALRRGAIDNLTAVMVCFHSDPLAQTPVQKTKVRRSISAEGLQSLECFLEC